MISFKPISYADSVRAGKFRKPGFFRKLINTSPNRSDAEQLRPGYAEYDLTPPTENSVFVKTAGIQIPEKMDFTFIFDTVTDYTYLSQIYNNGILTFWNKIINYGIDCSATIKPTSATHQKINVIGGLTQDEDFYSGWMLYNITQGWGTMILNSHFNSSSAETELTVLDGLGYSSTTDTYKIYRFFQENPTSTRTFNNSVSSPPCIDVEASVIRVCGGQSSTVSNAPYVVFPLLNRSYFPNSDRPFSYNGTYITERRLLGKDYVGAFSTAVAASEAESVPTGYTYFLASALIYDGYQIGELYPLNPNGVYVATDDYKKLTYQLRIPGWFNKRVTGVAIYLAQCVGDVSVCNQNYFYITKHSFIDSDTSFTYTEGTSITDKYYASALQYIGGGEYASKGNTYTEDSGIVESPTDTMYNHSGEAIVSGRHFLYNVYIGSEAKADAESVFCNPIGGNASINSGIPQPDIFSNEDGYYRLRPARTLGTKINGLKEVDLNKMLVLKDRGIVIENVNQTGNDIILQDSFILSPTAGCSTFNGFTSGDENWLYFAGYDDVYRYRENQYQSLIESPDSQDWLYEYRELITKAYKEAYAIWYLPWGAVYLDFGVNGSCYTLYPSKGWRQVTWNSGYFSFPTVLQDGTVLVNNGKPYRMQDENGLPYPTDDGEAIIPYHDTGDLVLSGSESKDFLFNKFVVNRTVDTTLGNLKAKVYKDGSLLKTISFWWKHLPRLNGFLSVEDNRRGYKWRMIFNSDSTYPERLKTTGTYQIDSYEIHGEEAIRVRRSDDYAISGSQIPVTWGEDEVNIHDCGKVNGSHIVTLMKTDTAFLFDTASIMEDATYRIHKESAHPYVLDGDGNPTAVVDEAVDCEVTFTDKATTGFTARADADYVQFIYSVIP